MSVLKVITRAWSKKSGSFVEFLLGGAETKGVTCFSLRGAERFWTDVIIKTAKFHIFNVFVGKNGLFYPKKC